MVKKIRILHIVPSFGIGGLEHGVAKIANGLPPSKFQVDVLALFHPRTDGETFSLLLHQRFIQIDLSQIHSKVKKLLTIFKIIRKGRYQIVHTHNWPTIYGVIAAKLAFVPIVIHGEHSSSSDAGKNAFLQRIFALLPDHFTAICIPLVSWIEKYWNVHSKKITYIPNGIDIHRFYPEKQQLKKDTFTLGTVGRLEKVKNIPLLIESFKHFTDKYPEAKIQLLIIGNGTEKDNLDKLSQDIGVQDKIRFIGETKSPEKYYNKMDVYINPNTNKEGMNNCILEAMACGLPVITSDLSANRTWLNENQNVLFFNDEYSNDLEKKIDILYNDQALRRTLSNNNIFRIRNEFTIDLFIQRNMKLYLRLLQR